MFGFGKTTKLKEYITKLETELRNHKVDMTHMMKNSKMSEIAIDKLQGKIEKLESKIETK